MVPLVWQVSFPYTSWPVIYFFVVIITIWCLIYVHSTDVKQSLFVKMKLLLSQWVLMSQNEGSYLCYWCHDFSDCWFTFMSLHRYSRAERLHHHEINWLPLSLPFLVVLDQSQVLSLPLLFLVLSTCSYKMFQTFVWLFTPWLWFL